MSNFFNFGYLFQVKVVTSLIQDVNFLKQVIDVLKVSYFENEGCKWFYDQITDYYTLYKSTPTLDVIKVQLESVKDNPTLVEEINLVLKDIWKSIESEDLEFVKDKTETFCRNQELKNAIYKSVDLLKDENYDGIWDVVNKALTAGVSLEIGHDYVADILDRYAENLRSVSPTPWSCINQITKGGLGKGELGCVVAPSGAGKSWMLCAIGAYAFKMGLQVNHYTLELNELYTARRYDTILTGISDENLDVNKHKVKDIIENCEGRLLVKDFQGSTGVTVNSLRAHLEKCVLVGQKPNVIIVDYADLLNSTGIKETRLELDKIYKDLRALGGEFGCPVWTASQANRSSLEEEVIEADKIAESYNKVMVSDFIISLSRKTEDKLTKTGRIHVIKNRFGPDGVTFPMELDPAAGVMKVHRGDSLQGKNTKEQMERGKAEVKKILHEKYNEFFT